jgi:hypothetical protein
MDRKVETNENESKDYIPGVALVIVSVIGTALFMLLVLGIQSVFSCRTPINVSRERGFKEGNIYGSMTCFAAMKKDLCNNLESSFKHNWIEETLYPYCKSENIN